MLIKLWETASMSKISSHFESKSDPEFNSMKKPLLDYNSRYRLVFIKSLNSHIKLTVILKSHFMIYIVLTIVFDTHIFLGF